MKLHHIAYVCRNVEQKAAELTTLFGCAILSGPVEDMHQGVRIVFAAYPDGTCVELLEPLGPKSPVQRHLDKGGGFYHLCFEVDDLDRMLADVTRDHGAAVVRLPAAAPAIDGRRVAFIVTAQQELVEFVEAR